VKAIDVKVLRDLWRQRGQFGAIVLVIACGVGAYLAMSSTIRSLRAARAGYYAEQRFGHVFASLARAPESLARRLGEIPGVQAFETRVVADVILDVPGRTKAATGRIVSLPDRGRPAVNNVSLRRGRYPEPGRWEEVVAGEAFVEAHGFELGQTLGAILEGARVELSIVGVGLSPEYTYSVGPGQLFPDDSGFGVFWMRREGLARALDMDGAFNDLSLRLGRDAAVQEVIACTDRLLADHGGRGAIAREDQLSAFFLANELRQLVAFVLFVPTLFLVVASFLLEIVLGRLVAGQRGDIAALKAFGYRDRDVGLHYAKTIGLVVAMGWLAGLALGDWMGGSMTRMYSDYYRFPTLEHRLGLGAPLEALALCALGAGLGAWGAIRRTVALPPAEAMRPLAPTAYRPTVLERLGLADALPTAVRIVLREIERYPRRAALSIAAVAMATALTVVMTFTLDSVRRMLNLQFGIAQREDVQLVLAQPRATGVLSELRALPGVLHAEPLRNVPVELRAGRRHERATITGLPADARLGALLDADLREVALPPEGLVLARKLAELLDVRAGESLDLQVLEGRRPAARVPVTRLVETFVGTAAYMELGALARLLGEPPTLDSARLLVDDGLLPALHAQVKRTPMLAGIQVRDDMLTNVRRMLDENLGTMILISLGFALALAFGVLYNTARITLAERARELATLRVLGYRRSEVGAILIYEMVVLVLVALPLGLAAGYGLAAILVRTPGYDTEQFRLPLVVSSATYATAVAAVLVAGAVSGWSAWRRLDRFDIVEVLKSRD
jgi:putative ABC transport system permease protein